jgi:uncharacterized surface protein with fasciclin (FAS1) repeats
MLNIAQVVRNDVNMTALSRVMVAAGLEQVLSGLTPLTVFAPSDQAFSRMESGTIENLLKAENKIKLKELLNQHIVAGTIEFKHLKDGQKLKSINGKELLVHVKAGKTTINGATLINPDVKTSSGAIYSLDAVLNN